MKIQELKQRAWQAWNDLNEATNVVASRDQFDAAVRQIGDRRRKSTWERAIARFMAGFFYATNLDSYNLILHSFNFKEQDWDYELRHLVIDEFLMYPDGLEMIRDGLIQIYSYQLQDKECNPSVLSRILQERSQECRSVAGSAVQLAGR